MKSTNNNLVSSHKKCSGEFGWSYYKDDPLGWFRMFDLIPRFCGKYICTTSGPDCGETVALFQSDLEILYRMTSELLLMRFKRHCPVLNEESEVLAAHKVIIDKRYFRRVIWQKLLFSFEGFIQSLIAMRFSVKQFRNMGSSHSD